MASQGEYVARPISILQIMQQPLPLWMIHRHSPEKSRRVCVGSDPAGHPIVGGGSDVMDDHLFMYQIMSDGAPLLTLEALSGKEEGELGYIQARHTVLTSHLQSQMVFRMLKKSQYLWQITL